jgi:ectoine hydroxylase-related dioxygenase (phytanoyl-CoA dioxygenase family)
MTLDCNFNEYVRDGITVCRGAIPPEVVRKLINEVDAAIKTPSNLAVVHKDEQDSGRFLIDMLLHQSSSYIRQVALHSQVAALAKRFLPAGPAYFFYDQLFVKEARTITRTQWHQDLPYWPLLGTDVPSLWVALTACDDGTSSVQYVRGSHLGPVYVATNHETRAADRAAGLEVCPDFHHEAYWGSEIIRVALEPGDVVVHHPLVVHGAGPNTGTRRRVGLSFRYCAGSVRWQIRPRTMSFPAASKITNGTLFTEQDVFPPLPDQ